LGELAGQKVGELGTLRIAGIVARRRVGVPFWDGWDGGHAGELHSETGTSGRLGRSERGMCAQEPALEEGERIVAGLQGVVLTQLGVGLHDLLVGPFT
jgi:hypothetical protein